MAIGSRASLRISGLGVVFHAANCYAQYASAGCGGQNALFWSFRGGLPVCLHGFKHIRARFLRVSRRGAARRAARRAARGAARGAKKK